MHLPRRDRGFTLVELLVVIAIISLLIAMLLPALGKVRQATIKTTCATHIRQLSVGYASYAASNNDWLPQNNITYAGYGLSTWETFSLFWIKDPLRDELNDNYGLTRKLWDCPAAIFPVPGSDVWPSSTTGPGFSASLTAYSLWAGRTYGNWGTSSAAGVIGDDLNQKLSHRKYMKGGTTLVPWFNCHAMYKDLTKEWLTDPEYWGFNNAQVFHWREGVNSGQADGSVTLKKFTGAIVNDPNADSNILKFIGPIYVGWQAYWGY